MTKARDFLGPYRLTRLIRLGSSCQVWEAIDDRDQKRYALKVLREDHRKNKTELAAMKHEFEVAQTLHHPRIIRVIEQRIEQGVPFIVLELFSELNCKQALRRGPEALAYLMQRIIDQAGEGVSYMHSKGWIHRDLKPDNFLVSREGDVKLIDFSIAIKKRGGLGKLFQKTNVQGTRSYMSPEQIRGQSVDERSDCYSFGCVLFELLAGRPPFTGDSPNDLLNKHLTAPIPSPITFSDNVSQEFADLVRQMLAKNPDHRPQTIWDFLKRFRATKLWRRPPRLPDANVFDDMPSVRNIMANLGGTDGNPGNNAGTGGGGKG
jgi:serine/threonine-protein kinase